jgi:hypothetical protein
MVAIKATTFSSNEAPCMDPKALFSFCISFEWGGGSKHFFPSLDSNYIFSTFPKRFQDDSHLDVFFLT